MRLLYTISKLCIVLSACLHFTSTCNAQARLGYFGDTLKGNVKKMTETRYSNTPGMTDMVDLVSIYTWDTISRTETIKFFREDHTYLGMCILKFDAQNRVIENSLSCSDAPCTSTTYQYDQNGDIIKKLEIIHPYTYNENDDDYKPAGCNILTDWLYDMMTNWPVYRDSAVTSTIYKFHKPGQLKSYASEHITYGQETFDTTIKTVIYNYDSEGREVETKEDVINIGRDTSAKITYKKYNNDGKELEAGVIETEKRAGIKYAFSEIKYYNYNSMGDITKLSKISAYDGPKAPDSLIEVEKERYGYTVPNEKKMILCKFGVIMPDTTREITEYSYNDNGKITEEVMLSDNPGSFYRNWYSNGREVTRKKVFRYDKNGNLVDKAEYYQKEKHKYDKSEESIIAEGTRYEYDSLNRHTSNIYYRIIRKANGEEEFEETSRTGLVDHREEMEYDEQMNIIKVYRYTGAISLTRDFEYY